ncbi:hypothetical protein [Aeromicrobium sp.]|uniref:hypothetical protein n=1 Tax=Aeromicrobium sp. TaxID=1871063 RepID=UPI0019B53C04|nr:hypothetical protein [Aeromicrobium sp.]MBC7631760.1 hypothetical protein [Aeromicrobium sp.]
MNNPSRRARKIGTVVVTPIAILAAAALVWQSSYAAFSGTTRNSGNSWSTGSVALTDDDSGSARFQAAEMVPGATETKCIAVTANATVPGVVKGYAVNPVVSAAKLADYVKVSVRYGTGGGFGSCTNFVSAGVSIPETSLTTLALSKDYATGAGAWSVIAGTQTRTYEITWKFDTTGLTQSQLDALQGAQTGIDFQWELQSS